MGPLEFVIIKLFGGIARVDVPGIVGVVIFILHGFIHKFITQHFIIQLRDQEIRGFVMRIGAKFHQVEPYYIFLFKTCRRNSRVSYQKSPPGSGVPVEGIIEGSRASRSKLINTLSLISSITLSVQ